MKSGDRSNGWAGADFCRTGRWGLCRMDQQNNNRIAEAQQAGQVRRDLPARDLAELVVATVAGGIMQARLQKKNEGPMSRALDTLRVRLDL